MDEDLATQIDTEIDNNEPAQSMDDTIRATLDSMKERNAEGIDELIKPAEKADRNRDKVGKFAKERARTEAAPLAPNGEADQDAQENPVIVDPNAPAAPPVATPSQYQPPSSFTSEGKAAFAKASPEMQKEVLKREADFHKHFQQSQPAVKYAETMYSAVKPYEQTFRQMGAEPVDAIKALLATDHKMRHGSPQEKMQGLAILVKEYGIDLSQGMPEQQPMDPHVEYLQQQNRQAMQAAQQAQQQVQELQSTFAQQQKTAEDAQMQSVIDQASKTMPHIRELGHEIKAIVDAQALRGNEITLDQAYEAALWQSPKHRQELLVKQQAEKQAEDAKRREAEAALARSARQSASINVQRRGTLPAQKKVGSMDDTIREALAAQRNR